MLISEIFYSLQGEGARIGSPSVFVRFFGCNFRCPGFGMPVGHRSTEADDIADEVENNPQKYPNYESLPLAKTGCDSYPSWHPKLVHYSKDYDIVGLDEKIKEITPHGVTPDIVFTGGEPLLPATQKFINDYLVEFGPHYKFVTFETNGTMKIQKELRSTLCLRNDVIFSVSPKLSCSGVDPRKAIRYDAWDDISGVCKSIGRKQWYLKFVVHDEDDVNEMSKVISEYQNSLPDVYIMPEGGVAGRYNENLKKVADIALKSGYILSPRLHVTLFGNSWSR